MKNIDYFNPIRSINGVQLPCPNSYQWELEDISASDAGRTEDTVMNKKTIGKVRKISLSWINVTLEDASTILKAVDNEYFEVCYLDTLTGLFETAEFYIGNRAAPLYNAKLGVWSKISFNIIERSGVNSYV